MQIFALTFCTCLTCGMPVPTYIMYHPEYYRPTPPSDPAVGNNRVVDTSWSPENAAEAKQQWLNLATTLLAIGADIWVFPSDPGYPDQVFAADGMLTLGGNCVMGNFAHPERQCEGAHYLRHMQYLQMIKAVNQKLHSLPANVHFEGWGNTVYNPQNRHLYIGTNFRGTEAVIPHLQAALAEDKLDGIFPIHLKHKAFYHLDTCKAVLHKGELVYYPMAFDTATRNLFESIYPVRIKVSKIEANAMGCNLIPVDENHVVMTAGTPRLKKALALRGYKVQTVNVSQFQRAGGSVHCLTQRISDFHDPLPKIIISEIMYKRHTYTIGKKLTNLLTVNPTAPVYLSAATL